MTGARLWLPASAVLYSTVFAATENPLRESAHWLAGAADGLDWHDCESAAGKGWGLQSSTNYTDATALLAGASAPATPNDQYAKGTVYVTSAPDTASYPEVELRLRSALGAHSCTGYEVTWALGNSYLIVARWNGAVGSFDYLLFDTGVSAYNVANGDVVEARIVGTIITAYKNGVLQATVDVTSIGGTVYSSGAPGMGFNWQGASPTSAFGYTAWECGSAT